MLAFTESRAGTALVVLALAIQVSLFWLSMDAGLFAQISAFCTGSASSTLGLLFGLLHLALLGLLPVGILSLGVARLRLLYIGVVAVALTMLPVQAALVSSDVLWCDGP